MGNEGAEVEEGGREKAKNKFKILIGRGVTSYNHVSYRAEGSLIRCGLGLVC